MSLKKQFDKESQVCRVTFMLDKNAASAANHVHLTGDFNNWNTKSIPMKKVKDGGFSASVDLKKGKEYQFKYIIDGKDWLNEPEADRLVPNAFKSHNSLISL